MAVGFRDSGYAGEAQSATVSSLTITVSSFAVAGDLAVIAVQASGTTATLTTPTGWTLASGAPYRAQSSTWLYSKTVVSGDIGATVTLTFSTSVRCDAVIFVASGTQATFSASSTIETTETSSPTLPSLSGVATGSLMLGILCRSHASTSAPGLTLPARFAPVVYTNTAYGTSPNQTMTAGWFTADASGTWSGGSASSSPSSSGVNLFLALPATVAGGSAATAPAATAVVNASGAAAAPLATGVSAAVQGVSPWPPDPYRQAVRSGGFQLVYSISAFRGGAPVAGAQDMRPIGGTITDTNRPGVRWSLDLELAPEVGLYDLLTPSGTTLIATAVVTYPDQSSLGIPMGVYDIDSETVDSGAGKITLAASDKWVRVQRARFIQPTASTRGVKVTDQIATLIQSGLGGAESVVNNSSSQATVGALSWDRDRDKAILELCQSIGAWIYFDRIGQCTIADIPQLGIRGADWLIDATDTGVLVSLDRQQSRQGTFNVVVVSSSSANGAAFTPVAVWDSDPASATYAGTDPLNNPGSAGPFGVVPIFYSSPILGSAGDALTAGRSILSRTVGLSARVSLSSTPNPAVEAFAVFDVMPPKERRNTGWVTLRNMVDTVTHPLVVEANSPMQIVGRSTRTDPYTTDVLS